MKTPFEVITVTETNLRVEALRHGKQTTVEIPVSELEDLVAPSRQEIMVIVFSVFSFFLAGITSR